MCVGIPPVDSCECYSGYSGAMCEELDMTEDVQLLSMVALGVPAAAAAVVRARLRCLLLTCVLQAAGASTVSVSCCPAPLPNACLASSRLVTS